MPFSEKPFIPWQQSHRQEISHVEPTPYTSKLHNSKEYRVVHVSAGQWHDPLRCKLIDRRLDDAYGKLPYRALSYVWGSSLVTDTIDLEEMPFQITLNLSCALRHLRKVDGEILLWVDALCINQQDHQERGFQVSIMQLIYKNAEEVVVFMGDGRGHRVNRSHLREPHVSPTTTLNSYERNKLLLTDMLSAAHCSGPHRPVSSLPAATCAMGLILLFSVQETVEEGCMELMKLSEGDRCNLFEHFKDFVTCPWWSRIWVVQEIAVGTVVTIHYGTISLPWETLIEAANVWSLPKTRQVAISAGIEPENLKVFALFANQLNGLEQTRRKWRAEGGTDLIRLLQEFSDRQASDDRDKVYGLLSLAKQDRLYIKPNYGLDVFETYRFTVLGLIGQGESLECWAGDQKRKFNKGLPSWIPDWSTAVENGDKRRMDLFDSYGANCGWTLRIIESEMHYWTTVEDEMELLMNSQAGQELPASLNQFVLDYITLLMGRSKSLIDSTVDEYILETLSMDRFAREWSREVTAQSILYSLEWCESHNVIPRSGRGLLRRWIRDLRKHPNEMLIEQEGEHGAERSNGSLVEIGRHLKRLVAVARNDDLHILQSRMRIAQLSFFRIKDIVWGEGMTRGTKLYLVIESFIGECWRLSSLCKATDTAISPSKLFKASYTLQGAASWLTECQSEKAIPQRWGAGLSSDEYVGTPDRTLAMQTVVVDSVIDCGPRHFGWADTESALNTLVSWLYLSGPVIASGMTAERGEVELNNARIRQFTKTIVGGMCRRGGSYQKADDTSLGPLEDWLRQCLMDQNLGWESSESDTSGRAFVTPEDWTRMPAGARIDSRWVGNAQKGDPVVPRQEWLRKSLESRSFAAPPSPFLEDIQVATDGRVFFLTGNGSMGLGPASMRKDDTIHILPSGRAHFVLRGKPMESVRPNVDHPEWMKVLKPDRYELIGDCYLSTNSALDGRISTEEEPVVKGSLPFELLGARYLKSRGLLTRETAVLV